MEQVVKMSAAGVLSAIIVMGVLVVLGGLLYRRALGDASMAGAVPTNQPVPTPAQVTQEAALVDAEATALAAAQATVVSQANSGSAASGGGSKSYSGLPPMTIDPAKEYLATITTPRGDIVIKLRPDIAPKTVNSFTFLANEGFYDGLTWHRVLPGFMAQGGDPTGTGTGGPGYSVPAEFNRTLLFDRPGILAMARAADPDSAGSQFFITTAPAPHLNGQYTSFGEVIEGQDIVNDIPLRDPMRATEPGEQMLKVRVTEQ